MWGFLHLNDGESRYERTNLAEECGSCARYTVIGIPHGARHASGRKSLCDITINLRFCSGCDTGNPTWLSEDLPQILCEIIARDTPSPESIDVLVVRPDAWDESR